MTLTLLPRKSRHWMHLLNDCTSYKMEISAVKTKLMTNCANGIHWEIKVKKQSLERFKASKTLGQWSQMLSKSIVGSLRIARATAALTKLEPIWTDNNISLVSKVKLIRSLGVYTLLHACELWTLTAELEKRTQGFKLRCYRRYF